MSRPERIVGPVLTPLAARAQRAVVTWVEGGGDLRGVPLEVVQRAVAARAEELRRDLDAAEVAKVCRETIAAEVDRLEQAEAQAAIDGAREEERARYLREASARYKLLSEEYSSAPRGRR